jgi:hypothetical protein
MPFDRDWRSLRTDPVTTHSSVMTWQSVGIEGAAETSSFRRTTGLSKSRITAFEQCPRKLWLSVHRPDLMTTDPVAEVQFQTGHEIGAIACALEPDGVMIDADPDLTTALNTTRALIDEGHPGPLFEATFVHDGVLVRVDVLARGPEGGWVLAEVKSTAGVKAYHHGDVATQVWVLSGCGLQVSSAVIRHIDNRFVLTREGDYRGRCCQSNRNLSPVGAEAPTPLAA